MGISYSNLGNTEFRPGNEFDKDFSWKKYNKVTNQSHLKRKGQEVVNERHYDDRVVHQYKNEVQSLSQALSAERSRADDESNEKQVFKNKVVTLAQDVQQHKARADNTERALQTLQTQYHALHAEKQELATRLSALMSSKLRDQNPAIADLSDLNRPTKIAEQFSELYDNEWTEAFDQLHNTHDFEENQACDLLLELILTIYRASQEQADTDLNNLITYINKFSDGGNSEVLKNLKDDRKKTYKTHLQRVEQNIRQSVEKMTHDKPYLIAYITKCIELSWLMVIQDPPVYMDTSSKKGHNFDTDRYKAYTKTGPKISFVVWPVLFLAKGQGMLSKGVAQGGPDVVPSEDEKYGAENISNPAGEPTEATAGDELSPHGANETRIDSSNVSNFDRLGAGEADPDSPPGNSGNVNKPRIIEGPDKSSDNSKFRSKDREETRDTNEKTRSEEGPFKTSININSQQKM